MPEMDGLTTVRRLREASSTACVIMCSTLTTRGASAAIDALMLGANDYVTKPSNTGPMDSAQTMLHDELIPKIKQFFESKRPAHAALYAARAVAVSRWHSAAGACALYYACRAKDRRHRRLDRRPHRADGDTCRSFRHRFHCR